MRIARVRARRAASCEMPAALPCRRWFRMEPRSAAPAACGRSRGTSVLGGSHCRSRAGRAVRGVHRFSSRGVVLLSSLLFPPLRFTSARVLRRPSLSARQRRVRISALCIRRAPWCKPRVRTPRRARSSFVVFGSLRRLFVVSRSCRARVASSSLSLLALRGFVVASTLSATRLRTPPIPTQRDAGRGVAYLRVDSRRPFPISRARALPLCVSVCAWPHRPLATGQRPCCLLWLA